MNEFNTVFQNVAFPVGVCVVLFYVLFVIIKNEITQNNDNFKHVQDVYNAHLGYLQQQNERLTQIISECTKALNDNTKIFNDLISILNAYKKTLKTEKIC